MRIDHVGVVIVGYVEFEGSVTIRMDWNPAPDDPLVAALLERNQMQLLAAAKAEGPATGIL